MTQRDSKVRQPSRLETDDSGSLAHYEISGRIGHGGMGAVFRARDRRLGRIVALKVLLPELNDVSERRSRFLREARAAAALNHPNIATLYEIGSADIDRHSAKSLGLGPYAVERLPYIAMELVEGGDLGDLLADGPLSIERALELTLDMLSALGQAHDAGVIHRDLKPANVMITRGGTLKLLDFGLAKILDGRGDFDSSTTQLTLDGMVMGTLPYVAPEQLQGDQVDARADLFSLGMLLYEMLTGTPPLPDSSMVDYAKALLLQEIEAPSTLRQDVPPWLDDLVLRLLALEAEGRYASTAEVQAEIARHAPRLLPLGRGSTRMRWALVAAGLALVGIVLGIGWWLGQRPLLDPAVALERGTKALHDGDLERAQRLLSRAVELDVNDPRAWYLLGEAYRLRERPEFATASYDQALDIHRGRLDLDPWDPGDLAWSAFLEAKTGDCDDALEALEGTAAAEPELAPDVLITRARTYAVCDRPDRAGPLMAKAEAQARDRGVDPLLAEVWAPELQPIALNRPPTTW